MTEIACIIPSMEDLFSLSLINGVLAAFPANTYICHIFQSFNPTVESYLLQRCMESDIAGIVLFPQNHPFFSDQILSIQLKKYPLVLLDRYLPRLDTSYVIADHHAAGALCLQHLYELFSQIGFRIPDQISLMSFDRPVINHKNPDFFTYISQSESLMGREAGTILKNRIENHDLNVYHKVITPTLKAHQSTRPIVL